MDGKNKMSNNNKEHNNNNNNNNAKNYYDNENTTGIETKISYQNKNETNFINTNQYKICYSFQNGYCSRGSCCKYLHDQDSYNQNLWKNKIKYSNYNNRDENIKKKELCYYYLHGSCIHNSKCKFLHPKENLKETVHVENSIIMNTDSLSSKHDDDKQNKKFKYDKYYQNDNSWRNEIKNREEQSKKEACKFYFKKTNCNTEMFDDKSNSLSEINEISFSDSTTLNNSEFLLNVFENSNNNGDDRNFHLKEYVDQNCLNVAEIFNQARSNIEAKRNKVFEHDYSTLNQENDAIDVEEKILIKQEETFNTEMIRLNKITKLNLNTNQIKNAYDREFRRAKQMLPIYAYRHEILNTLNSNDVFVLVGPTGSGKSTQIVQYLLEAGLQKDKKIACTQPRKVACISLAKRISEELCISEDSLVTFNVGIDRYNSKSSEEIEKKKNIIKKTKLILMTDRKLLNEYQNDNNLSKYSCIIIDEAHERTMFSDILLCQLKKLVLIRKAKNNPLKLIIMSATIDHLKFSKYFNNCPIIQATGHLYPVKINYEKIKINYLEQTFDKIKYIIYNRSENPGDILVFLTSFEEIQQAIKKTEKFLRDINQESNYICLRLYGRINVDEQTKVFLNYNGKSKIIFATNVAETSITIDGVKIVIDCGRSKERIFDQGGNVSIFKLNMISQSSAIQRKGRAGRTSIGVCYRLYEEKDYNQMEYNSQPEVFRINLGLLILQLLKCNVSDPINNDLIDQPDKNLMSQTLKKLTNLSFIDENMKITSDGLYAVEFNQEPQISRFIIEGIKLGVEKEITIIVSMLSVLNFLYSRSSTNEEKIISTLKFSNSDGDLVSLMNLFNSYKKLQTYESKIKWCNSLNLSMNAFKQAEEVFADLWFIVQSISKKRDHENNQFDNEKNSNIINAIYSGLHTNLAYLNGTSNGIKVYKIVELNQEAFIHPSSSLYVIGDSEVNVEFVLFTEIVRYEKLYIKNLTPVNLEFIKKYTKYNLDELKINSIKQKIEINVNPIIIDYFKSYNNQYAESLEEKLGYAVNLKNDSIMTEVLNSEIDKSKEIINEYIDSAKERLIKEFYEYKPDTFDNVKVIVGKGLKLHTILLNREYLRLNFYYNGTNFIEKDFLEEIQKIGTVLEFRSNKLVVSKVIGYVVMNDFESAKSVLNYFKNDNKLVVIPSASIENNVKFSKVPIIKASWFLTPPTGLAFITFKTQTDLNKAKMVLEKDDFKTKLCTKNTLLELMVLNVTKDDNNMDEIKFKKYLSKYSKIENCVFIRTKLNFQFSIDDQKKKLETLFSQFGEIESIVILKNSLNKKNELKPRVDANIIYKNYQSAFNAVSNLDNTTDKIGYGIFHAVIQSKEEIKVPGEIYNILKYQIQRLINFVIFEFDCKADVHKMNRNENLIYLIILKCKDINNLKKSVKLFDELLEPEILTLPYLKFDKIRKKLNKDNFQEILQSEHDVFIIKDSRYNQIKIYGKNRREVADELQKNVEDEVSFITLNVKSFKAIFRGSCEELKQLKDEFRGEIKCDFKKKTITLYSKLHQLVRFEEKIKKLENEFDFLFNNLSIDNKNMCNICFCECEGQFRLLVCDHLFCFECIKAQILNFDMNSTLECVAEGCDKPFTIADIKKLTYNTTKLIDQKCYISLNNYLIQSKTYKICRICKDLCRITDKTHFYCERCLTEYCSNCHKQNHDGLKCDDVESNLLNTYLAKYTKNCPNCSLAIEKNQGCNHMVCSTCKSHFCWLCLFSSAIANDIYEHMNKEHGGIFDTQ